MSNINKIPPKPKIYSLKEIYESRNKVLINRNRGGLWRHHYAQDDIRGFQTPNS